MILALDTCNETGSLALLDGERVLEERRLESSDGFGHVLFGAIDELLRAHGVTMDGITLFAAATGPGAFTGVRVCLTAAKGLAYATGRPLAGVTNLEALASLGTGARRAPLLDARRGDVYCALYDAELRAVLPERVCPLEEFEASLPAGDIERIPGGPLLAGAIGRIAARRGGADPALVDANYIRPSDAQIKFHP